MDSLKRVAKNLGVSTTRAWQIKRCIEHKKYPGVPSGMVWGTGNKKKYPREQFRKYLKK